MSWDKGDAETEGRRIVEPADVGKAEVEKRRRENCKLDGYIFRVN